MKLSNIRNFERHGRSAIDWKFTADVDVTTGFLWWKKTETKKVACKYAGFWFFVDTGMFTPGSQMEAMARPIEFQRGW